MADSEHDFDSDGEDNESRVLRLLSVKLTEDEWKDRARHVARLSDEIADQERKVEREKESAKVRVKDAETVLDGLSARQRQLSRIVQAGSEEREVACRVALNRTKMIKTVTRLDTMEVIETGPLSTSEAREGAEWRPNFKRDQCELIHPDEPEKVLDTREISDAERQTELAVGEKPADTDKLVQLPKKKRKGDGIAADEK